MTNDNEQPEAQDEQPSDTAQDAAAATPAPDATSSAQPIAAVDQTPQATLPAPAPSAGRRWRPSRGVVTVAAAAVAGVLLFGSGFAAGHAVDGRDDHRPRLMRDGGMRERGEMMPRDGQMPQQEGRPSMPDMPRRR